VSLKNASVAVTYTRAACTPGPKVLTSADALSENLKIDVTPSYTLKKGEDYVYTASYTMKKTVTGGKAKFLTSISGIPIMNTEVDLCDSLKDSPTPCPLEAGPIQSVNPGSIPSASPLGTLESKVTYTDTDGTQILSFSICFQITS
jgi:hypothetical protein